MRRNSLSFAALVASLLLALALVACGGLPGPGTGTETAAGGTVTGNVLYLDRSALDPNAVIEVDLLQTSADAADTVITTQSINAEGRQVPIPFELTYDPAQIDQPRWGGQPHVQQRDQALPARQDLGFLVGARQRVKRLVEGARGHVFERGRLHGGTTPKVS